MLYITFTILMMYIWSLEYALGTHIIAHDDDDDDYDDTAVGGSIVFLIKNDGVVHPIPRGIKIRMGSLVAHSFHDLRL